MFSIIHLFTCFSEPSSLWKNRKIRRPAKAQKHCLHKAKGFVCIFVNKVAFTVNTTSELFKYFTASLNAS